MRSFWGLFLKRCRLVCLEDHLGLTACAGKKLPWHLKNHKHLGWKPDCVSIDCVSASLSTEKILFTEKDILTLSLLLKWTGGSISMKNPTLQDCQKLQILAQPLFRMRGEGKPNLKTWKFKTFKNLSFGPNSSKSNIFFPTFYHFMD